MELSNGRWLGALLIAAWGLCAQAQGNSAALVPEPQEKDTDTCKAEVLKFEKNIAFIRSSLGNASAAKLREKLLPAKLESEILFKDGYCGLARHMQDKKLNN